MSRDQRIALKGAVAQREIEDVLDDLHEGARPADLLGLSDDPDGVHDINVPSRAADQWG